MGRKAKPRLKQGWYITESGGHVTKLARESEGIEVATRRLADLLGEPVEDVRPAGALTLRMAYERFMQHARVYYRLPSGRLSKEATESFPLSFRELLAIAGNLPAATVDRRLLRDARDKMIAAGLSRKTINKRIGRVKLALGWLAEEEIIPDRVFESVSVLKNLPAHRSAAPERENVKPVAASIVATTLPELRDPWASMVRLQWCTGMRPGEVVSLELGMIRLHGVGALLVDFGKSHKMAHKGRPRRIVIGEVGMMVLSRWLMSACVSGRRRVFVSAGRGVAISRNSYSNAVREAAERAGVPHWHPNQLRHAHLTRVRKRYGLDAAQVAGGHAKADVTEVYAEADLTLAERVAAGMG